MTENRNYRTLLKTGTVAGLKKGWSGFLWMMKIIFPISLFTAILDWSGLLRHLDFLLKPLMGLLSLPPAAALPLISGMLSSVYGGIAAMVVLPFSTAQMTLMAVFILMCHGSGTGGDHPRQLGHPPPEGDTGPHRGRHRHGPLDGPLGGQLHHHACSCGRSSDGSSGLHGDDPPLGVDDLPTLCQDPCSSSCCSLTFLELLKAFGWIHPLVRALNPFLRIMGLDEKVGFLWMTAVVFGLSYGGAIIVEEAKSGHLTQRRAGDPSPLHRDEPLDGRRPSPLPADGHPSLLDLCPPTGHGHRNGPAAAPLAEIHPSALTDFLSFPGNGPVSLLSDLDK